LNYLLVQGIRHERESKEAVTMLTNKAVITKLFTGLWGSDYLLTKGREDFRDRFDEEPNTG